ncbi:hypothetical protein TWF225_011751 [Orbilia oligospora]|uniref:Uncharacterized protein n=1 Tax=Orbilia oligospora TaxID=2813651 RepID=A0A7C8P573_ORBOL|nr:hypothetical protein TWF751_000474 [Orbilia oligospora]KAF3168576.1 hypothetical protein TWF225_011751 [Orbilia oligospora]KAF3236357.1 hypothetical protein TWF217_002564 [Orbilia oligospora]KAF3255206.1 hypothetical protein TWF128_006001 [Orbilia oligospora]KAF3298371.1 hypothetical protein TWF132_000193 [Orbilia oligospora]
MHFTTSFIAAAAAFLPLASAHVKMVTPSVYEVNKDNAPLDPSGANFPCKFPGGVGSRQAPNALDTYTPGVSGSFKLLGGATHGGGSCQISITYDNPPTKDSVFKVVQSYEGGCPIVASGNLGGDASMELPVLPVQLPEGLKAGEAVFVWTWFNRVGNREMYMNCAPITIGGSGSSDSTFNSLPDMFVANINGAKNNACTTKENLDIVFPNPGSNVRVVDDGHFGAACEGGPSTPGDSGSAPVGGGEEPSETVPSSTSQPPSVITQPALIGGPAVSVSNIIIATSFSDIGSPSETPVPEPVETEAPSQVAPPRTTLVRVSTTVAMPMKPVKPTPTPSKGNDGSKNGSGTFQVGPCDSSKVIIICGSDPSSYTQCFDNNMAYGPFAVPPGTECDSTGMGGFKAMKPVSSRFARRYLGRNHRRSFVHSHSF